MAYQAHVSFPGVARVVRAQYTARPGISPSVATLDIAPQPGTNFSGGRLEFAFGPARIALADCALERVSFHFTPQGQVWRLHLLDRRWRWRYGSISGNYNLRRDNGQLIATTRRTPRQLAELCLQAMGETTAHLHALPDDLFPTVEWDYHNPARALEQLAALCNCRVVLAQNGALRLVRHGTGAAPPVSDTAMHISSAAIGPAVPGRVVVVSGRVRVQCDLRLEAVGLDVDQEVRPLDQLSYRPYDGWSTVDPLHFQAITDLRARELALQSVFRWYRIATPFEVPGYGTIDDLGLVVPLEVDQVELAESPTPAANRGALVFGLWCDFPHQAVNRASSLRPLVDDPRPVVTAPFALDVERGIVKFERPVMRYDTGSRALAAQLVLRTALGVRDPQSRAWHRIERSRLLSPTSATTEFLLHDELIPVVVAHYDADTYALSGASNNFSAIQREADSLLEFAAARYRTEHPQYALYAGLHELSVDSEIDAVTWTVGPDGATTEVLRRDAQPHTLNSQTRQPWRLDTQRARRELRRQAVT